MTKSMLEKLTEHYWWLQENDNCGHIVGYYCEKFEMINACYKFPNEKFVLKRKTENFLLWHYNPA